MFIYDETSAKLRTFKQVKEELIDDRDYSYKEMLKQNNEAENKLKTIKLVFSKCPDQRYATSFIPFILMKKSMRI